MSITTIVALLFIIFLIQTFLRKKLKTQKQLAETRLATEGGKHFNNIPTSDYVPEYELQTPEWYKNAVLYQVNIRQFTEKGDFQSFIKHLPRLKELDVDILWLMPIFPICETNKKCDETAETECWGSPYAPKDFTAVHPKYGTDKDFKELVEQAHKHGMKVILDFVPNHTGWDSVWMEEHPEWYVQKDGKIRPVTSDQGEEWADIAQLDLSNSELREAWMQVHEYWVKEFDIDGYREDCAWAIPYGWWKELRERLNALKPHNIFMVAEDEVHGKEQFNTCFEVNYGWGTHHYLKQIYKEYMPAAYLYHHTFDIKRRFGTRGSQMNFTQNHDENTWHGAEKDLFGEGADCYTALCFCIEGMPLIYNGQEASLDKRLLFFNKDEIDWSGTSRVAYFKTLIDLKHRNKAIWNNPFGGELHKIKTGFDSHVYAFYREKDGDKVLCIFNMRGQNAAIKLSGVPSNGNYVDIFSKKTEQITEGYSATLKPYEFRIFEGV